MNRVVLSKAGNKVIAAGITEQEFLTERRALNRIGALTCLYGYILPAVSDVVFARRSRDFDAVTIVFNIVDIIDRDDISVLLEPHRRRIFERDGAVLI